MAAREVCCLRRRLSARYRAGTACSGDSLLAAVKSSRNASKCRSVTSCRYSCFSYSVSKKNITSRCDFRTQTTAKCVCRGGPTPHRGDYSAPQTQSPSWFSGYRFPAVEGRGKGRGMGWREEEKGSGGSVPPLFLQMVTTRIRLQFERATTIRRPRSRPGCCAAGYNRLFMKLFRTKSIDVVEDCQYYFGAVLSSVLVL